MPEFMQSSFKRVSSFSRNDPVRQSIPYTDYTIRKTEFSQVIFNTKPFSSGVISSGHVTVRHCSIAELAPLLNEDEDEAFFVEARCNTCFYIFP